MNELIDAKYWDCENYQLISGRKKNNGYMEIIYSNGKSKIVINGYSGEEIYNKLKNKIQK